MIDNFFRGLIPKNVTVDSQWKANTGIQPKAKIVDLKFAGDPELPEQLDGEHVDDWYWELRLGHGRISYYRIIED